MSPAAGGLLADATTPWSPRTSGSSTSTSSGPSCGPSARGGASRMLHALCVGGLWRREGPQPGRD
eukprot:7549033-Lingulodinium_polyedra.AAC.1